MSASHFDRFNVNLLALLELHWSNSRHVEAICLYQEAYYH